MISLGGGGGELKEGIKNGWYVGIFWGHDFIVLYVVYMYTGCLTLADTVRHNKGDI